MSTPTYGLDEYAVWGKQRKTKHDAKNCDLATPDHYFPIHFAINDFAALLPVFDFSRKICFWQWLKVFKVGKNVLGPTIKATYIRGVVLAPGLDIFLLLSIDLKLGPILQIGFHNYTAEKMLHLQGKCWKLQNMWNRWPGILSHV
jgi:hypothetical protein